MEQKTNYESFMDAVVAINKTKEEGLVEVDIPAFYLGEIALFMAVISDELHEINQKIKYQK